MVSDANGCTATSNASLIQPTQITYTTAVIDANCGNSNGSIEVTAAGGSGSYTYSKDAGVTFQPSNIFASLVAGSYDIVVRDVMDCMEGAPELVQNVAAPVILSTPVNNVSCNGVNDGSLTINVNGGTGVLSYSIDGGFTWQSTNNFTNLQAGNYNISVSDATGCLITSSAIITQPGAITINASSVNATCGNNDGSISIVANGGSGALVYSLNGGAGQANGNFGSLGAGNYNVIITDASGCSATSIASISNTNAPVIASVNNTNVTCNGQNDGSITISANGGTGALSYSIDNGSTTQPAGTFNNLSGGTYSILVTDANGCVSTSSVIIAEPDPLILNSQAINSTCGNPNGEIQTLVLGGTGSVQYSIDNGLTYQSSGVFQNLNAGNYSIVISDVNGCTAGTSDIVIDTPGPVVSSVPVTDVSCNGQNNGSATIQINGGTGPFDFSVGGGTTQTNNYFGGLSPGTYNVLITDANGCTSSSSFNITEPSPVASVVSVVNTACGNNNGTITVNAAGGTGSYSYSNNAGLTWQSAATFSNLSSGNYQVVTQDANGCTITTPAQIIDAPGPIVQSVMPSNNSCNNSDDGIIDITINGGTSPLQYSIDNGLTNQASNIFGSLSAGLYNILVTDANGCTVTVSQLITEPAAIATSVITQASTCNSGSNGSASVSALGGTSPYNYTWSNGTTGTSTANNLQAGTYLVTVSDANGCTVSSQAIVSNISGPSVNSITTSDNLCFNSNDGEMNIAPGGGTGPFSYSINNGTTTQMTGTFNNLAAGNYTVIITDANGCTVDSAFIISQPTAVVLAVASSNSTCSNSNGGITLTAIGGTGSYSYSINGGITYQTSNTFISQSAGTYNVIVQDQNGCTVTGIADIIDAPGPAVQSVTPVNLTCNNSDDGQVTVTAIGGTAPLQYSLNNGATFQSSNQFSNLTPGIYNIIVSDANGCTVAVNEFITEPDAILTSVASVASTCSGGSNGSASINVLGGTSPYNYIWSNGSTGTNASGNLQAGTYMVTVSDANGCTVASQVVVSNISGPSVNSITTIDNLCFNSNNGGMTITPNGGTGPFNYSLNNGAITQMTGTFNNLPAGAYSVSITDANGCVVDSLFSISQPTAVAITVAANNTTCSNSNGGITLTANGGTGSYLYSINGGLTYQTSNVFIGQNAGNYNVMVQDQNGCTVADVAAIIDAPGPAVQSVAPVNLTCNNSDDGQVTINATGGTTPLQYSIDNGTTFQTSNQFNNLSPGSYNIIISDANGCTVAVNEFITEPDAILTSVASVAALCAGGTNGSATVTVQGGIAPYNFTWSGGASGQATASNLAPGTYMVTVSDANGCTVSATTVVSNTASPAISSVTTINSTCSGSDDGSSVIQLSGGTGPFAFSLNGGSSQMSGSFNNLTPGNYSILITDANGCVTDSAFTISEPMPVNIVSLVSATTCSGSNGSITLTASGGSGIFEYSIDGGFTFQQDTLFTNVQSGTYNIIVQDANGCTGTDIASVIDAPGPDVQSVISAEASCYGLSDGSITMTATGGTTPMQYSIDNGITYQSVNTFNGLASGNYTIIVQDANGCTSSGSAIVDEPAELTSVTSAINAGCNGASTGSASATINGGTAPYNYLWSSGQTQPVAGNISAGSYTITVTDANGCSVVSSAIVSEPSAIVISESVTNTSCYGSTDGAVSINVSGGNAPFSYFWSVPGNGNQINDLSAGTYSVTVTDNNGCTNSQSYLITEPAALTTTTSAVDVSCFGMNNGSVTVSASGGTSPYSYQWSNSSSGSTAAGLVSGVYTVIITDANGCTSQTSETITAPDELIAITTSGSVTCNGYSNGTASVAVSGGTQPYSYLWSNGSATSVMNNINGGNYSVVITDANNCTVNTSALVAEPAALVVTVSGSTTLCIGETAIISASAVGGNGGYQFNWSNGVSGNSQTVSPGNTSSYSVSVVDSMGCPASSNTLVVTVNPPLSLVASPAVTICEGEQAQISAIASGGDGGPYTYHWSGLTQTTGTVTVSPSSSSTYTVTVTDGCTTPAAAAAVQIEVNLLPVVNFTPVPASGCAPLEVFFSNNTVTTSPGASYTWYFGNNNGSSLFEPSHIYYEPGSYTVTLKVVSVEGCTNSLEIVDAVNVYPVPEASFYTSPQVASILNPVIDFMNTSSGATIYTWDFGDNKSSFEFSPQHMYAETGIYEIILYVENDYGCRDTARGQVVVEGASTVYIPNAFTPNNDGVNDYFNVQGIGLTDIQMSIYNRWGQIVFTSDNTSKGWDGNDYYSGTKCPIGVYVYQVKVKSFKGDTREYVGRVTLVE